MYFDVIIQQCMIHRSIYDLVNQILSEILFYIFAGYLLDNSINYHVDAISYNVLFVLDFSTNMVNPCGKQYIVLSSTGIHLFNHVKALLCWLILYILNFKKRSVFVISINWLK